MQATIYQVKTHVFEGPIELLLHLIKERKLPINEISLAEVTENYIQTIGGLEPTHYRDITQFVVVASTLVLIKSKTLLPMMQLTDEEEQDISDLERRLQLYNFFRDLGVELGERFLRSPSFPRPVGAREALFSPHESITKENLYKTLHEVLALVPKQESLPETRITQVVRIEEMMETLVGRIEDGLQLSFNEFVARRSVSGNTKDTQEGKQYVVVGFLAMLEMVRNGIIEVLQHNQFEDIAIRKR